MTDQTQYRGPRAAAPPWGPKPARGPIREVISGYRFYNPSLGRWINRDPKEEVGGLNLYVYINNDTHNRYDYLGLECSQLSDVKVDGEWQYSIEYDVDAPSGEMAIVRGANVTWKLKGSVECCCPFLIFWEREITKTVYKTREEELERSFFPIMARMPGNLPITVPTPITVGQAIGNLIGAGISGTFNVFIILDSDDVESIARFVADSMPATLDEGDWPEDPCNQ